MIFLYLFNTVFAQTTYPSVNSLAVTNLQNYLKITASCSITSDIYYAVYLNNGIRPSFEQLKTRINNVYPFEYYGLISQVQSLEQSFLIKLNSHYNVDIYCLNYDITGVYSYLSYPSTKDLITTLDNGSKTIILKMYFDTQPTVDQIKNIICQAQYKYPQQVERIIIGDWTKCINQVTPTTNQVTPTTPQTSAITITKTYQKAVPYVVFLFFLEDFITLLDVLPDELFLQDPQEISNILLSNSGISTSVASPAKLVDSTTIIVIPELEISLGFSSQTLTASITITNTDGVIGIGITQVGVNIGVEEFFVQKSTKLITSDLTSIQKNVVVSYTITGLEIGKDYIVNMVGLLVNILSIIYIVSLSRKSTQWNNKKTYTSIKNQITEC